MVKPTSNCRFCGKPLTFSEQHTFRGTCENAECRMQLTKSDLREFRVVASQRHQSRRNLASHFANSLSPAPNSPSAIPAEYYPVPCMRSELTVLPEARRDLFLTHLQKTVDDAFAEPLSEEPLDEYEVEYNTRFASPSPVVIAACSTCRGDCCRQGETHAFITKELILRVRRSNPGATPQDIIEMYRSKLAPISHDGSCVYHQERGCGLPRDWRANICNSFECEDLHYISLAPPSSRLVLVSLDGEEGVRTQAIGD